MGARGASRAAGGCTVFANLLTRFQWARLSTLVMSAAVLSGCGSTGDGNDGSPKPPLLKPEQKYRYVGEGAAKTKVALTREELRDLRKEARKKQQGE
jgi:hypothetical protein